MRVVLTTILLATIGLAGCLDGDQAVGADPAGEANDIPDRKFEPVVKFDANYFEIKQGDLIRLDWQVTDLHDYQYPLTFIDWDLTYSGAANPVAEGDGNQLPGSYERILYKEAYHAFTFKIDDGQGFSDSERIIVKVGDPIVEDILEVAAPLTGYQHAVSYVATQDCEECVDASTDAWGVEGSGYPGALGCQGFTTGTNYVDCVWVNLSPDAWGHPFEVSSMLRADDPPDPSGIFTRQAGDPGSVDVEFWKSCGVETPGVDPDNPTDYDPTTYTYGSLGQEFIDPSTDVAVGVIPEGAGCMVAFDFAWPTVAGVVFTFQWTEDLDKQFEYYYDNVPILVPTNEAGEPDPCAQAGGCAPSQCPGLELNWNGYGCAWMEVTPNMWGFEFSGLGPADSDAIALESCSQDAGSIASYGNVGPESAYVWLGMTIPEGAGCIYFYDWAGYSGTMVIEAFEAY